MFPAGQLRDQKSPCRLTSFSQYIILLYNNGNIVILGVKAVVIVAWPKPF